EISRVREALEEGFCGDERRRAGGRGRIRQRQCPRLRPVEGAETGRGAMGDRDRPRPPGLAHRVLADVDEVPRRELRHSFRFFQAEDGIRDWSVTGVQTCALPISMGELGYDASTLADAEKYAAAWL